MRRKNQGSSTLANEAIKLSSATPTTLGEGEALSTAKRASPDQSPSEATSIRDALPTSRIVGADDIVFQAIANEPQLIMPGDLAVYQLGNQDPAKLVADAMARGAAGIISEQLLPCPLPQCLVGDMDLALASLNANLLNRPDRKLLTIGVAGPAGKTTTTLLLSHLFRSQNIRTAYQSDLGACDGVVSTTPQQNLPSAGDLVHWLGEAVDCEAQVAVVEISEHDARHGRYDAIEFDIVVVTGASFEDDDFGPSSLTCVLENLHCDGVVVYPADDKRASRIVQDSGVHCVSYGVRGSADLTAKIIDQSDGMTTLLLSHEDTTAVMETALAGGAMAANHAAAALVGLLIDVPLVEVAEKIGSLRSVPGRVQRFESWGHAAVVVDAAGDIKRCETALRTARSMKSGGRLWCIATLTQSVSDEAHLARLGTLVERFADHAVVTTTANQKQSFLRSSHAMLDGVEECAVMRLVADSKRALDWAMREARPTDTILWLTNQSFVSAHEERSALAEIENAIHDKREELEAGSGRPKLKVFS